VVACVLWAMLMAVRLHNPNNEKNLYLPIDSYTQESLQSLSAVSGIIEWYTNTTQGVVIIKYDDTLLQEDEILSHLVHKEHS
ncbi:MAG: MFS transporter, partial [Helicobacter sp.]|nr:MFS transporter [Helicobacter sp.]